MTIEEILDEMENALLDAARLPLTNKRIVEEDDWARLLDDLREALPNEIMEANRIVKERQRILEDAQNQAQNIIDQAKGYIAKLTDENIITQQAQEQANEIVVQARKMAKDLQSDAVAYAGDVFNQLESSLEKSLEIVRLGHANLEQAKKNE
ncbi:Hypothetical protein LUCI_0880 [Lucifera butyrica]|uniref:ATPase n=1 Tax=Lucifera butyrica TaxID=1351585 RepID=A0A498R4D5_9FIRM|nr:ATPase [Lucifera butyrica]VBB05670.1 Hypothetical protein LUCI_0880 [Lucifera butyrica]